MQASLKVKRFNPEAHGGPQSYDQEYQVDVPDHFTVLDALIKVREEIDASLALRCSCRASICGSCSMRINGTPRLACKTRLSSVATKEGQQVTVEPGGNLPVVKDLVLDMKPFWDKVRGVQPWLQPEGPEPQDEYIAPNEAMHHLSGVMNCIMCGACVNACTVLEVDPNFLGPAALAKAYRFVADPRDGKTKERLKDLNKYSGVWDCTRCFMCVEVCPKSVAPMDRIMALRDKAVQAGLKNTTGARHSEIFAELVEHSGSLDELQLAARTPGLLNPIAQLNNLPVGLRALKRGKMPPLLHKKNPDADKIRRVFKKVEAQRKEESK